MNCLVLSLAFLLWHLLLSFLEFIRCLILYVVSKPFIKHCWKFCFLTSASPLSFQQKQNWLWLLGISSGMKSAPSRLSDFSEHEMAVLILLASRQEPRRGRQRGRRAPSLTLQRPEGETSNLTNLQSKICPPLLCFGCISKKEVNSWCVFPACNHQFLSALSTVFCRFQRLQ